MRTLLLGASGQLGSAVKAAWPDKGYGHYEKVCFTPAHAELDITAAAAVAAYVERAKPDLLINCAAWTDMNGAEQDPHRAFQVNGAGAGNLARAAAAVGARMIHISTDCCDTDEVQGVYAESKWEGEQQVRVALPRSHTILRLSCLLSTHQNGWLAYVIRNASAGKPVSVSAQITYPTTVETVAQTILLVARGEATGTFCVAGAPAVSKHALACAALEDANIFRDCHRCVSEVHPDDSARAPRRVDSRLQGPWLGERTDWRPWLVQNAPKLVPARAR